MSSEQPTFHFADEKFARVWMCLQDAGWKHKAGLYVAPNGETIEDSQSVVEMLDQGSLPDLLGNLQVEEASTSPSVHRRSALEAWEARFGFKKGTDPEPDVAAMHMEVEGTEVEAIEAPRLRSRGTSAEHMQRSVTETSSQLYLHKKDPKRKRKASSGPVRTADLKYPTLDECLGLFGRIQEDGRDYPFRDWQFMLTTNHSLWMYGLGSKKALLERFVDRNLRKEGICFVLDGFQASVPEILDLLVHHVLDGEEPDPVSAIPLDDRPELPVVGSFTPWEASSLVERAIAVGRTIAHQCGETLIPCFLVIHNFEGIQRDRDALASLLVNSSVSNGVASIRLVASVDHVDASLQERDGESQANFAWMSIEVHTHVPYATELEHVHETKTRKHARKKNELNMKPLGDGVFEILHSLAPRHGEIMKVMAELQLDAVRKGLPGTVSFRALQERCNERFVVTNEGQVRVCLQELEDHHFVEHPPKSKEGIWRLPYNDADLRRLMTYKQKK